MTHFSLYISIYDTSTVYDKFRSLPIRASILRKSSDVVSGIIPFSAPSGIDFSEYAALGQLALLTSHHRVCIAY